MRISLYTTLTQFVYHVSSNLKKKYVSIDFKFTSSDNAYQHYRNISTKISKPPKLTAEVQGYN
jgi:hypothetical protein